MNFRSSSRRMPRNSSPRCSESTQARCVLPDSSGEGEGVDPSHAGSPWPRSPLSPGARRHSVRGWAFGSHHERFPRPRPCLRCPPNDQARPDSDSSAFETWSTSNPGMLQQPQVTSPGSTDPDLVAITRPSKGRESHRGLDRSSVHYGSERSPRSQVAGDDAQRLLWAPDQVSRSPAGVLVAEPVKPEAPNT